MVSSCALDQCEIYHTKQYYSCDLESIRRVCLYWRLDRTHWLAENLYHLKLNSICVQLNNFPSLEHWCHKVYKGQQQTLLWWSRSALPAANQLVQLRWWWWGQVCMGVLLQGRDLGLKCFPKPMRRWFCQVKPWAQHRRITWAISQTGTVFFSFNTLYNSLSQLF